MRTTLGLSKNPINITTTIMAEQESFWYDSKTGKLLGRTGKSWLKITIFYVIYYTFLGCLMYFALGIYKNDMESRYNAPRINTRVDQPGLSAVPATNVFSDNLNKNFAFKGWRG